MTTDYKNHNSNAATSNDWGKRYDSHINIYGQAQKSVNWLAENKHPLGEGNSFLKSEKKKRSHY